MLTKKERAVIEAAKKVCRKGIGPTGCVPHYLIDAVQALEGRWIK